MRSTLTLFSLFLACSFAFATDITLTDGRVLKDAAITSQTPRTVTIKHASGLASISKNLLPAELQAKYPLDEAAAREADINSQQARFKASELEQAEYQRALKVKAERAKTAKFNERAPVEEEANRKDRLYSATREVQSHAEKYFQTEYDLVKNIGSIKVTISDLKLIEGWTNRWAVRGKCEIKYNGEVVKVYPTYSAETVQAYAKCNRSQELDYTPYETTQYSQKTQAFEAVYTAETATPTFEVTLR